MPPSAAVAPVDTAPAAVSTLGTPAEAAALPPGTAGAAGGTLAPATDLGTALAALSQALNQLSAVLAAMTGAAQVQGGGAPAPAGSGSCRCGASDASMQQALDQAASAPVQSPVQAPVQGAPVAPGEPGADPAAKLLPSGRAYPVKDGKTIGHPHAGTHTLGNWQSDNALDIEAPEGTPIYAPADGVISKSKGNNDDPKSRFNGFNFELEGSGNAWFLQHLSKSLVKDGDHVKKGQLIGHVGSANGVPHLHIGQRDGNPDEDFRL